MTQPLPAVVDRAAAFWIEHLHRLKERDDALILALWNHLDQWAANSGLDGNGADDKQRLLAAELGSWYGKWAGADTGMDKHSWQNVSKERQAELDSIGQSLHVRLCGSRLTSIEAFFVTAMLVFHWARAMQQTVPPPLAMQRMTEFILNECDFAT